MEAGREGCIGLGMTQIPPRWEQGSRQRLPGRD